MGGSSTSSSGGTSTGGSTSSGGDGGTTTGGSGGATGGTGGATGGSGGATGGTGGTGDCKALTDAIAEQTTGVFTCATVVRLDYQTLKIKGYRIACDPYAAVTEAAARQTAQNDTGFGQTGQFLSSPNPEDEYVFYEPPLDFGGVGVVNARNGKSVFGGGIVWLGMGQISYPATFEPPASLGAKCATSTLVPPARGWDLRDGTVLPDSDVTAALDVVWDTALPDGLWQGGYVFDAVVLLYPPAMGVFDPSVAEWVVLVNSGWLE